MSFNTPAFSALFILTLCGGCAAGSAVVTDSSPATKSPFPGAEAEAQADPSAVYDDLVVFTSKATFHGNLGGLSGADEKCNTYAKAAGLKGQFRAWLSDSTTDAISRVPEGGPWRVLDKSGKQAAVAFADRESWTGYPKANLENTEFGSTLSDLSRSTTTEIPYTWTGTKLGGKNAGCSCRDWTSSENFVSCGTGEYGGAIGSRSARPNDEQWTYVTDNPCDAPAALLCFELP